MYHHFLPVKLQSYAQRLIADLSALSGTPTGCPYCQHEQFYAVNCSAGYYRCKRCQRGFNRSLHTPFYRLAPLVWLPVIAARRLSGQSYTLIGRELNCTAWVVKRRVAMIDHYMQRHYPLLYHWYQNFISTAEVEIPQAVTEQSQQLSRWVTDILQLTQATCPHCGANHSQKVAQARAQFRCQSCWRYFSYLKGTGLEHLGRTANWLTMIDLLVAGRRNDEIKQALNISYGTLAKAKAHWLTIMQQQNWLILKEWIISRGCA